jgi:hypothetical protein
MEYLILVLQMHLKTKAKIKINQVTTTINLKQIKYSKINTNHQIIKNLQLQQLISIKILCHQIATVNSIEVILLKNKCHLNQPLYILEIQIFKV